VPFEPLSLESDREGIVASSHDSELSDTRKRRRNNRDQGRAWILRSEITKNLLHNDSGQFRVRLQVLWTAMLTIPIASDVLNRIDSVDPLGPLKMLLKENILLQKTSNVLILINVF
jgi:hypothetical protein